MSIPLFLREYNKAESKRETPPRPRFLPPPNRRRETPRETPQQIARRAPNAVEIAAEEAARKAQIKTTRDKVREAIKREQSLPPEKRRDTENIGRSDPAKRGKFLRRAYADYQAPAPETAALAMMGLERDPSLNPYNKVRVKMATKKFKETHKWARDQKNAADLDVAVKYLLSKPRYRKTYYSS